MKFSYKNITIILKKWWTVILIIVSNCPVVETVSHSTKRTSCGSSGYAITYKCETSYEVTAGNAELTCADNGTWLGTTPTCSKFSWSKYKITWK